MTLDCQLREQESEKPYLVAMRSQGFTITRSMTSWIRTETFGIDPLAAKTETPIWSPLQTLRNWSYVHFPSCP
jgi:hypothetical protein